MASLGGRHRQRDTGRLLSYFATFAEVGTTVLYCAAISDGDRLLAAPDGSVDFDASAMSADEAARQDIGRYIDTHEFGEGVARKPNWTDYGPWK